jgi:hypothetical protein
MRILNHNNTPYFIKLHNFDDGWTQYLYKSCEGFIFHHNAFLEDSGESALSVYHYLVGMCEKLI